MHKIPTLNLTQLQEPNSSISNMMITYDLLNNEMNHSDELKYYCDLYNHKTNLANREIVFVMSDEDLIKLNQNESPILYIKLMPHTNPKPEQKTLKSSVNNSPKNRSSSPKRSHRIISPKSKALTESTACVNTVKFLEKTPRLYRSDSCIKSISEPTVEIKKRKRSSSKAIIRSKTADDEHLTKILSAAVMIDNIVYNLNYKANHTCYNVFKIEKVMDNIFCSGVHDYSVSSRFLISNNYESKTCVYEHIKYELIYTKPLDFTLPFYICEYTTQITATNFIYILPKIVEGFNF